MKHQGKREWLVLCDCPLLVTLHLFIERLRAEYADSNDENSLVGIVENIHLDLPSLEALFIQAPHTLTKCSLACPKLVDLEFEDCKRMVTFDFDGGEQLQCLRSEWKCLHQKVTKKNLNFFLHRPFYIYRLNSCSFDSACAVGGAMRDVPKGKYWANLETTLDAQQATLWGH